MEKGHKRLKVKIVFCRRHIHAFPADAQPILGFVSNYTFKGDSTCFAAISFALACTFFSLVLCSHTCNEERKKESKKDSSRLTKVLQYRKILSHFSKISHLLLCWSLFCAFFNPFQQFAKSKNLLKPQEKYIFHHAIALPFPRSAKQMFHWG